jgi:hypothetical protein
MAYEEGKKHVGASDKPKFKTSAQLGLAEQGRPQERIRKRLDAEGRPYTESPKIKVKEAEIKRRKGRG